MSEVFGKLFGGSWHWAEFSLCNSIPQKDISVLLAQFLELQPHCHHPVSFHLPWNDQSPTTVTSCWIQNWNFASVHLFSIWENQKKDLVPLWRKIGKWRSMFVTSRRGCGRHTVSVSSGDEDKFHRKLCVNQNRDFELVPLATTLSTERWTE